MFIACIWLSMLSLSFLHCTYSYRILYVHTKFHYFELFLLFKPLHCIWIICCSSTSRVWTYSQLHWTSSAPPNVRVQRSSSSLRTSCRITLSWWSWRCSTRVGVTSPICAVLSWPSPRPTIPQLSDVCGWEGRSQTNAEVVWLKVHFRVELTAENAETGLYNNIWCS